MSSSFLKISKAAVVIACFFLAAFFTSLAFPKFDRVHWYRQIFLTLTYPVQNSSTSISGFFGNIWKHYIALTGVAEENDSLKKKLAEANAALIYMEDQNKELGRYKEILSLASDVQKKAVGADVVASNVFAEFKTIVINKGYHAGIRKNNTVIGAGGLVGKIGQVADGQSTILLISDPNSAVDVFVQRSGARAVLVGTSIGTDLRPFFSLSRLEYLKKTSNIQNGDVVVTSGLDRLFPKGIPVGTVQDIQGEEGGVFKSAEIVPFVDLQEVREVAVLQGDL